MTVRRELQAITNSIHLALHEARPFAEIASGQLTMASYNRLLGLLLRYHLEMNKYVVQISAQLQTLDYQNAHSERIKNIKSDMHACGAAPQRLSDSEQITDFGYGMGCSYVAFGSVLGGKTVSKQLEYLLPDPSERRFFAGSKDDGKVWQRFCAALEKQDEHIDRIVDGAMYSFKRFQQLVQAW